jgi:hypothetical protein
LSACYPLRVDSPTPQQITGYLSECVAAELVVVYEVDRKQYLELLDFQQRTRSKESKFPDKDGQRSIKNFTDDGQTSDKRPSNDRHARTETETETKTKQQPPARARAPERENGPPAAAGLPLFLSALGEEFPELDMAEEFRSARDKLGQTPGEPYMRKWLTFARQNLPKPKRGFIPDFIPKRWREYLRKTYPQCDFNGRWESIPRETQIEAQEHFIDEYGHNGAASST